MTKQEIINNIIKFFQENNDALIDCMEELDSYNGYLNDDRYYDMQDLDEIYRDTDPSEILARAFYGYDEDCYTKDSSGNLLHEPFNPNRNYFRFNAYGNLVSADYKDYTGQLDKWFIEKLEEERHNIDSIDEYDELTELFDALEEADDE